MTPARRHWIGVLIYSLVGTHLVAIAGKIDEWPVSYYGMFSEYQPSETSLFVLYGVTTDGQELRLQDDAYWAPLRGSKLNQALKSALQRDMRSGMLPGTGDLPQAVASLRAHYENRRQAGEHTGPPLTALRLYQVTWRMNKQISNLDQPDRRKLVYEHASSP